MPHAISSIFLVTILLLTLSCGKDETPINSTLSEKTQQLKAPKTQSQKPDEDKNEIIEDKQEESGHKVKEPDDAMLGLYWLEDHQNEDGSWSANFHKNCGTVKRPVKKLEYRDYETHKNMVVDFKMVRDGICTNKDGSDDYGQSFRDELTTAFALLAFLSVGYGTEQGEFASVVKGGIDYLIGKQQDSGRFAQISDYYFMLSNAVCTFVVAQIYALSENETYKQPAKKGMQYLIDNQLKDDNGEYSGWGSKENDSKVNPLATSWVLFALRNCRSAAFKVPDHCWKGISNYFASITTIKDGVAETNPDVEYLPANCDNFVRMPIFEAVYSYCRLLMGDKRSDSLYKSLMQPLKNVKNWISDKDPDKIDFMYWYFAVHAMGQYCGQCYKNWESTKINTLLRMQRTADSDRGKCVYGSWDPVDAWGNAGGRVYSTAMCTLVLSFYIRTYGMDFNKSASDDWEGISPKKEQPVKKKPREKTEAEKIAEAKEWEESWRDW